MSLLPFIITCCALCAYLGNHEFYLNKEFDQLKSIYEKEDPEVVNILTILELPRNWDALMNSSKYLPTKSFSKVIKTIHSFKDTIISHKKKDRNKEQAIADAEGEQLQKVYNTGVDLEERIFSLSDSTSAEDVAAALTKWLLHLKKHEAFWQRHNYNIPRLLNTLKYLLRHSVAAYMDIKGDDAEAEVVRESLKELHKKIGAKWDWYWFVFLVVTGACLLLLLISSFIFFLRFRRK